MSEVKLAPFGTWYGQLFQMYQNKQYAKALEIANREGDYYPQQGPLVYHFRACMAACMGDGAEALRWLNEATDKGYWYTALYWDDADFNAIRDDPEFVRLRAISEQRYAEAQAKAKPELTVVKPAVSGSTPLPVLIALHGNNSSVAQQGDNWRPAAESGWLVGLAQASQIVSPTAYVWDDEDKTSAEIRQHYAALIQEHGGDPASVILSGFSRGGEMAIRLALTGDVLARGFIAIAPGGPITNDGGGAGWEPIIAAGKDRGVRGYVIVGKQDQGYDAIRGLIGRLEAAGLAIRVEEHDDLGHEFPADFGARLHEMLAFVIGIVGE